MELRKYREFEEMPKLRILKRPGDNKEPIKGFIILIIVIISIVGTISVVSLNEESEPKETLQEFVDEAIQEKPVKQKKFELGKTTPKQIERVQELLELDVSEYRWIITNYDVRHIWSKLAHGIKKEDFLKIYSVLNTYDSFTLAERKRKDIVTIELYKYFDYRLKCIVEVRTGKKELVVLTMYKNKIKFQE